MTQLLSHLIAAPIVLPLVTAALLVLLGEKRKRVKSLVNACATLAGLAVAATILWRVDAGGAPGEIGVYLASNWQAPFGIVLVADRLSALMLVLVGVVGLVNLVSDGAPALALGVDPPDEAVMQRPPRSREERVVTGKMWFGIFLTGIVTAVGTLLVLDASMPGGLIEGHGDLRRGQTRAFTTLVCFSLFTVFNSRSDDRTAFRRLFVNGWLWGAVLLSAALQVAVIYVPFLQVAFGTVALSAGDWLLCIAVASSVLWVRELGKLIARVHRKA